MTDGDIRGSLAAAELVFNQSEAWTQLLKCQLDSMRDMAVLIDILKESNRQVAEERDQLSKLLDSSPKVDSSIQNRNGWIHTTDALPPQKTVIEVLTDESVILLAKINKDFQFITLDGRPLGNQPRYWRPRKPEAAAEILTQG
jgi:hypothetical protein